MFWKIVIIFTFFMSSCYRFLYILWFIYVLLCEEQFFVFYIVIFIFCLDAKKYDLLDVWYTFTIMWIFATVEVLIYAFKFSNLSCIFLINWGVKKLLLFRNKIKCLNIILYFSGKFLQFWKNTSNSSTIFLYHSQIKYVEVLSHIGCPFVHTYNMSRENLYYFRLTNLDYYYNYNFLLELPTKKLGTFVTINRPCKILEN
jgi:hypothetical protein